MKTIKQLLPKIKFIKKSNVRLHYVNVVNNGVECTDLETTVRIKNDYELEEGLHHIDTLGLCDAAPNDGLFKDASFDEITTDSFKTNITMLYDLNRYASKDETRIHLNSICYDGLNIVATNGHILKTYRVGEKCGNTHLLPKTSVNVLVKLLKGFKNKDDIVIKVNDSFAIVDTADFTLKMRLIQRDYVKYQQVIPNKFDWTLDIDDFVKYTDLRSLFKKDALKKCTLKNIEGNIVLIPHLYPDNHYIIGKTHLEFEIFFNVEYLNLAANSANQFSIQYNNEMSPVLVNGTIVMPIKK